MECHACPWSGKAKLKDVPFESSPCASCVLHEGTPRDWAAGMVEAVPAPEPRRLKAREEFVYPEPGNEVYPAVVVTEAVRMILSLPPLGFSVLQGRYRGLSTAEIAGLLGLGRRKVEYILSRVVAANPVLAALFPTKLRRGPRAKKT